MKIRNLRNILFHIFLSLCWSGILFAQDEVTLEKAVVDFSRLQKDINQVFESGRTYCSNDYPVYKSSSNCTLSNYCEKFKKELDGPVLYAKDGEQILNESFVTENYILRSCYKGTFKDDIKIKVEEFEAERKSKYLKEVYDLNSKLKALLLKTNENNKYARLNQEIIEMNLKASINGEEALPLAEAIAIAEKKLKVKLSPEALRLTLLIDQKTSDKTYLKESKIFERKLFPELVLPNPFYDFDNFTDLDVAGGEKKLIQNQAEYSKKAQEVADTFLEAKNTLIDYLTKKKTKSNQSMIDRAIERVKLVKFKTPSLSDDFKVACEFPNAWYNTESNTMTVCPQWFNQPKINLFETLAHELSHSIDPCNFSAPLKIKSSKADEVEAGAFDLSLNLEKINQSETLFGKLDNQDLREKDQKCASVKDYPFKSMLSCLQSDQSIGAKIPDLKLMKKKMEETLERFKAQGRNPESDIDYRYLKEALSNFDKYKEQYGLCHSKTFGGVSQIEEAFADKMASELVAMKLSKTPSKDAQKEIEKIVLYSLNNGQMICPAGEQKKKMRQMGVALGCKEYFENKKAGEKMAIGLSIVKKEQLESHPSMDQRINKIFFAHPKLREILGCGKDGAKYCED